MEEKQIYQCQNEGNNGVIFIEIKITGEAVVKDVEKFNVDGEK